MAKRTDKEINGEIERAFYQKAVGGWLQREEKTVTEEDGKGTAKEKKEVVLKQMPPDLDAIKAWLKERDPKRWRGEAEKPGGNVIRVVSSVPRPDAEDE